MPALSYNLSASIKINLQNIEALRYRRLTAPVTRKRELQNSWGAIIAKVFWTMKLGGSDMSRAQVARLLSRQIYTVQDKDEVEAAYLKYAIDYIAEHWYAEPGIFNSSSLLNLHRICEPKTGYSARRFNAASKSLEGVFEYLAKSRENAIIQSGVMFINVIIASPFKKNNFKLASLASLAYLYKHGFDTKELIVMEEEWGKNPNEFVNALLKGKTDTKLTRWLEFYTDCIISQMKRQFANLKSPKDNPWISSDMWNLNSRQKEILSHLENPDNSITTREAKHMFKISQITAARDLLSLKRLGLIKNHGKGRSVKYTKIYQSIF